MIISVSRRTDIPAFFSDWFFDRLAEGIVQVANPYNPRQVRTLSLLPQDVDGFVFWTKNPAPMLSRLDSLAKYASYFQCTLTGNGPEVEPGLPDKNKTILPAILELSNRLGPQRVLWRFDPMVFGGQYTPMYHAERFDKLAAQLSGRVAQCVTSFYAPYAGAQRRMAKLGLRPAKSAEKLETARLLGQAASKYSIEIACCAEAFDLSSFGFGHARCVDADRLAAISGWPVPAKKDKNQRPGCGCVASVDIGVYGSCPAGCAYCYAMRGSKPGARFAAGNLTPNTGQDINSNPPT